MKTSFSVSCILYLVLSMLFFFSCFILDTLYLILASSASANEWQIITPSGLKLGSRVMTILSRFGKGRPIDSNVFRPIITGWPVVIALNLFKSSGIFQRSLLFFPNSLFLPIAATILIIGFVINELNYN